MQANERNPLKQAAGNAVPTSGSPARKRMPRRESIPASEAKAHLLRLLDQVERDRAPVTITKRGRVIAQLVPFTAEKGEPVLASIFGRMQGSLEITGDIVAPDPESWGPDWK